MHHTSDRILILLTSSLVIIGFSIFRQHHSVCLLVRPHVFHQLRSIKYCLVLLVEELHFIASVVHYRLWRQYAFYIFLGTLILTCLVFVPFIGFSHGGATRWLKIGSFTLQPSEFLKLGFVIYIATWLSGMKAQIKSFTHGTIPFLGLLILAGVPSLCNLTRIRSSLW